MAFFCEPGSAAGCDLGVLALGVVLPIVAAAAAVAGAYAWRRINYRLAVRRRLNDLVAGAPSSPREPAAGARKPGRRASSTEADNVR